jgi:hypothetical protein
VVDSDDVLYIVDLLLLFILFGKFILLVLVGKDARSI